MVGCGRGSGWGWVRRCQDSGARGLGEVLGDPYHLGGGSNTEHGTIHLQIRMLWLRPTWQLSYKRPELGPLRNLNQKRFLGGVG